MSFVLLKYLILIIYYVKLIDGVKFRCDYTFDSVGWFKYHKIPMIWSDARLLCHLQGAILASPTTTVIRNIMKNTIDNDTKIFTGIHSTASKGMYYSVDGISLDEIPHIWSDLEPDNKHNAENCLAMDSEGHLSDVNCDEPQAFICYRENSSKDVNICGTIDPEYHFNAGTNKCYKFHTNPRPFLRAQFVCSAEGGHLAIINSEQESTVIKDIFANYPSSTMVGNFWKNCAFMGFYNWGEDFDWTTMHGQSLHDAGFDKFSFGQPDNAGPGEYCGSVFRTGLFNDIVCDRRLPFICEKKPDSPSVCSNNELISDGEIYLIN